MKCELSHIKKNAAFFTIKIPKLKITDFPDAEEKNTKVTKTNPAIDHFLNKNPSGTTKV